jgi:hypothetical protein
MLTLTDDSESVVTHCPRWPDSRKRGLNRPRKKTMRARRAVGGPTHKGEDCRRAGGHGAAVRARAAAARL